MVPCIASQYLQILWNQKGLIYVNCWFMRLMDIATLSFELTISASGQRQSQQQTKQLPLLAIFCTKWCADMVALQSRSMTRAECSTVVSKCLSSTTQWLSWKTKRNNKKTLLRMVALWSRSMNRAENSSTKVLEENPLKWSSIIEVVLFAHHVIKLCSTKYSPFKLLYSRYIFSIKWRAACCFRYQQKRFRHIE